MKKVLILPISLALLFLTTDIRSQMVSQVNSTADDEFAHAYDFQATPDFDESTDGVCEDSLHRCTLRAALEEAAILGTSARVTFSIIGVIIMNSAPGSTFDVPDGSFIQGFQQNIGILGDFSNTPAIFGIGNGTLISGLTLNNALIGIIVGGNHNRIGVDNPDAANYITGMTQNGILVAGDSNEITGNVIGLDILGHPESNPFGVFITGRHNTIGGTRPGEGNIISGNDKGIGVYTTEDSTFIFGNKIGTSLNGTQAAPNRIGIDNIGPNLIIGNNKPDGRNVISGNTETGVLFGIYASSDYVLGNNIGTDSSGALSIPNRDGITLGPGTDTCIISKNLIKHNAQNGILISGINTPQLITRYNLISGNTIQENGNAGIAITGTSTDNVIGSSLTQSFDPNEISYNGQVGIVLAPGSGDPQRNTIRENISLDNTSYGIRIISGQGGIQPPVFESYTDNGSTAIVLGTHNLAGAIIDLYAGDVNQANRLEGIEWIGSGPVDANGQFSIQISSCICDSIVATATDAIGNTSEFSDGLGTVTSVGDQPDLKISARAYPNPFNEMTTIEYELDQADDISLNIYDITGHKIETLRRAHQQSGIYQTRWNATTNLPGFYYYQLKVGNHVNTGKLVYIK